MWLVQILKKISILGWLLILCIIGYIILSKFLKAQYQEICQNPEVTIGVVTSRGIGHGAATHYKYMVDSITYFSSDNLIKDKQIGDSVIVVYSKSSPKKSFLHQYNYQ